MVKDRDKKFFIKKKRGRPIKNLTNYRKKNLVDRRTKVSKVLESDFNNIVNTQESITNKMANEIKETIYLTKTEETNDLYQTLTFKYDSQLLVGNILFL